ncbi:hypothetical protein BGZ75_010371, partial [Mortierella antarctica]
MGRGWDQGQIDSDNNDYGSVESGSSGLGYRSLQYRHTHGDYNNNDHNNYNYNTNYNNHSYNNCHHDSDINRNDPSDDHSTSSYDYESASWEEFQRYDWKGGTFPPIDSTAWEWIRTMDPPISLAVMRPDPSPVRPPPQPPSNDEFELLSSSLGCKAAAGKRIFTSNQRAVEKMAKGVGQDSLRWIFGTVYYMVDVLHHLDSIHSEVKQVAYYNSAVRFYNEQLVERKARLSATLQNLVSTATPSKTIVMPAGTAPLPLKKAMALELAARAAPAPAPVPAPVSAPSSVPAAPAPATSAKTSTTTSAPTKIVTPANPPINNYSNNNGNDSDSEND